VDENSDADRASGLTVVDPTPRVTGVLEGDPWRVEADVT
jgi:hypothetical protein